MLQSVRRVWKTAGGVAGQREMPRVWPKIPTLALGAAQAVVVVSLTAYLAFKLTDVVVGVPHAALLELTLVPAAAAGLALAFRSRWAGRRDRDAAPESDAPGDGLADEAADRGWWSWLAAALLLVFTVVFVALNTVPSYSSRDETAAVLGGRQLLREGSLRIESPLNEQYDTNVIGNGLATYRKPDELYYRTLPGTAILHVPFAALPETTGFYLTTGLFSAAAIASVYWVGLRLLGSRSGALLGAALFATSPVFAHWGVTVYNNVPVLALELAALALILSASGERLRLLGVAGVLMGLAVFVRVTELVFVLPMLGLVWWRTRALRPSAAFIVPALGGVAAFFIANAILYGDAFFSAYVGKLYLPPEWYLPPESTTGSEEGLLERYLLFITGTRGSVSNLDPVEKLDNVLFHLRYLGSSTFAFPFLAIGSAGLVWRIAAGRRHGWLLGVAVVVAVAGVILLYGHQRDNYFGFGEPVVRSSFVRYSLPIYALLAVAGGAFFLEAARSLATRAHNRAILLVAVLPVLLAVGIGQSYDWAGYGFNRLNTYREAERASWAQIEAYLDTRPEQPLLIGGLNVAKLVDAERYPEYIDYSRVPPRLWNELLWPVVAWAGAEREVYLIVSDGIRRDQEMKATVYERSRPSKVLRAGPLSLHRLR